MPGGRGAGLVLPLELRVTGWGSLPAGRGFVRFIGHDSEAEPLDLIGHPWLMLGSPMPGGGCGAPCGPVGGGM